MCMVGGQKSGMKEHELAAVHELDTSDLNSALAECGRP